MKNFSEIEVREDGYGPWWQIYELYMYEFPLSVLEKTRHKKSSHVVCVSICDDTCFDNLNI